MLASAVIRIRIVKYLPQFAVSNNFDNFLPLYSHNAKLKVQNFHINLTQFYFYNFRKFEILSTTNFSHLEENDYATEKRQGMVKLMHLTIKFITKKLFKLKCIVIWIFA